jgi:hypothetical protein
MSKIAKQARWKIDPKKYGIYHEYFEDKDGLYFGKTKSSEAPLVCAKLLKRKVQYIEINSRESLKEFVIQEDETHTSHNAGKEGNSTFTASRDMEHAIELMIDGDKKMIDDVVKKSKDKINEKIRKYTEKEVGITRDVEGIYFDVGLVMQGEPEAFYNSYDETMPDKFLHIDVQASYYAYTNAEDVMRNVVNLIVAVSLLEAAGHRISINTWWMSIMSLGNPNSWIKLSTKSKLQALNISALVSIFHPSFFRRIIFRVRELFGCVESGYGVGLDRTDLSHKKYESVLDLSHDRSVEEIIDFIKKHN